MIEFTKYIKENNGNFKANLLLIVDVQEEFSKFIPHGFVDNLIDYSKQFESVYQIWDSNDANKVSYKFANQKEIYIKKFGTKFSEKLVETIKKLDNKYPTAQEGFKIKLIDIDSDEDNGSVEQIQTQVQGQNNVDEDDTSNAHVVRINNKHRWFFVTTKISDFFETLKGQNIIIVGGAAGECIQDVYVAMKSFDINVKYNESYMYSAKNNNSQNHDPKTQSQTL